MKYFTLSAVLLLLIISNINYSQNNMTGNKPKKQLILTTPDSDGIMIQYIREVSAELSRRSGIEIKILELPKKRALILADNGTYDGVAMRLRGLEKTYPNLHMVDVPVITVQHVVFAIRKDIINEAHDFNSLNRIITRNKYLIGYLMGSVQAKNELSNFPEDSLQPLNSPEQCFKMLESDKIQAYLAGPAMSSRYILRTEYPDSKIREIGIFSEFPLFTYIHVKNTEDIEALKKGLQSMQADGTLKKIRAALE